MTVTTFDPKAPAVKLTPAAVQHFAKRLQASGVYKILRLSTETSGCTGYAYVLDMVDSPEDGDEILQPGDHVTLAIDPQAITMLRGTEIDFIQEGVNRVVKFNNPNVIAECGCGESFSVG